MDALVFAKRLLQRGRHRDRADYGTRSGGLYARYMHPFVQGSPPWLRNYNKCKRHHHAQRIPM